MIRLLYSIKVFILSLFGDIKYYKYPMWIVYCPVTYKAKGKQYREVKRILKAGDVIVRGYDDYLDGVFIPGRYSHSSIYMGNNENGVIHSIAEGVCRDDICDFLRCDRFAVLRPTKHQATALNLAKKALGKKYDFNFEIDNGKFYCHELTASCYPKLDIPLIRPKFFFGLFSASPVYLAESFFKSPDFKLVYEFDPKKIKKAKNG